MVQNIRFQGYFTAPSHQAPFLLIVYPVWQSCGVQLGNETRVATSSYQLVTRYNYHTRERAGHGSWVCKHSTNEALINGN